MSERRVIPVSRLVRYLKGQLEGNSVLHGLLVEGEISNLRMPYSGHWYFSLKDDRAAIPCVMFASANRNVKFPVHNGDKVVVRGDVTVYESEGRMQVIASGMQPSGIGSLFLQLEALKKKLYAEGLFDPAHRKPLPAYPMNIAVVTGNQTAARSDVLITLEKRWPAAEVHEYTAPVQGAGAAPRIIEALKKADEGGHDIILLVRGGGSIEDLWCFNDEALARTVYALHTPVVTGVGHETDTTLVDYVADLRANTPTGAVEAATPDIHDVSAMLHQYRLRMIQAMDNLMRHERTRLDQIASAPCFRTPQQLYREQQMRLDYLEEKLRQSLMQLQKKRNSFEELHRRLTALMLQQTSVLKNEIRNYENRMIRSVTLKISSESGRSRILSRDLDAEIKYALEEKRQKLEKNMRLLDAYSPLKVLDRGYSIVSHGGSAVRDAADLAAGDLVDLHFSRGGAQAKIINTTEKEEAHGSDKKEDI